MKASRKLLAAAIALGAAWTTPAFAHCDTLDGPVVGAAREALATGQLEPALIWVDKREERTIRAAFAKARASRTAGAVTDGASDRAFYATLVRVHRQGEGETFSGLKPAGTIAPHVAAADAALQKGSPAVLEEMIVEQTRTGLRQRYAEAMKRRGFAPGDVDAGRAYVGAYVAFLHHAERLHDVATGHDAHAQAPGAASSPATAGDHGSARPAPAAHGH